jgi:para-nitrobenzyl esterase
MASPLSKGLIAGAIGESGSVAGNRRSLAEAEQAGVKFTAGLGLGDAPALADLRRIPADKLLEAAGKPGVAWFWPIVDGYFLPRPAADIYAEGKQARVPLLAGSNSAEGPWTWFMGGAKPTVENYRAELKKAYGDAADEVFKLYPARDEAGVLDAAQDLASDRFISLETWRWLDLAAKTGGQPVFYYLYSRPRPPMRPEHGDAVPGLAGGVVKGKKPAGQGSPTRGACHSCEIEYAMGNLELNGVYAWTPEDHAVSRVMQNYFANFVRTGDPNGPGLPEWPRYGAGKRQVIDVVTRAEPVTVTKRYELLGRLKKD